jgi:hypothetical protein
MKASDWIAIAQASVALLLTGITFAYVIYTKRLTKTAREQLDAQIRPYIWVDLFVRPSGMIWVRIKNAGSSGAQDVQLQLSRELRTVNDTVINELPMFAEPLSQLPPGVERRFMLGSHVHLVPAFEDVAVSVSYGSGGRSYHEDFTLSMDDFKGTVLPQKDEVAKEIEALRKQVEKLAKSAEQIAKKPEPLPPLGPW